MTVRNVVAKGLGVAPLTWPLTWMVTTWWTLGCGAPQQGKMTPTYEAQKETEGLVAMQPKAMQPSIVGAFDFEILGDAEGKGCFDRNDTTHALGYLPYVNQTGEAMPTLVNYAVSAALYDAITKTKDADSIIVTWTRSEVTGDKACAEIRGKAIRLTKAKPKAEEPPPAPTVVIQNPAAPPPVVAPPAPPAPPPPPAEAPPSPTPKTHDHPKTAPKGPAFRD